MSSACRGLGEEYIVLVEHNPGHAEETLAPRRRHILEKKLRGAVALGSFACCLIATDVVPRHSLLWSSSSNILDEYCDQHLLYHFVSRNKLRNESWLFTPNDGVEILAEALSKAVSSG